MLKVAAFKISEDVKINELFSKYRLAPSAHIMVSNGEILIPYEDGEPLTNEQLICAIRENKNTILRELAILQHSQKVNVVQIADVQEAFNVADTKYKAKTNDKALEKAMLGARDRLDQMLSIDLMNQAEITRLKINIHCYDQQIAELQ